MCSEYEAPRKEKVAKRFGLQMPSLPTPELFKARTGVFLRRPPELSSGDEAVPRLELQTGRWGLVPYATRPEKLKDQLKLDTFNARDDRVEKAFTFRSAWQRSQRCIVPAEAIYEPDWRTGKAIRTRFTPADDDMLYIAGLWDTWRDELGQRRESYTMLTLNADNHELFKHYHREGKEKRMVALLYSSECDAWLDAPIERAKDFIKGYPADLLVATPAPRAKQPAKAPAPAPASAQGTLL